MNVKRSDRIGSQLKEEISNILIREIKDPAISFVTIVKTKVSNDLRYAKVYYSVMGGDEQRAKVEDGLQRALPFIRSEVGHRLKLRFVPELKFIYDDSAEYAERIDQLIKKIHEQDDQEIE